MYFHFLAQSELFPGPWHKEGPLGTRGRHLSLSGKPKVHLHVKFKRLESQGSCWALLGVASDSTDRWVPGSQPIEELQYQLYVHLKFQQEDNVSFDASEVEVMRLFTFA